jgi:nucleoside-triphosphatase THEP1
MAATDEVAHDGFVAEKILLNDGKVYGYRLRRISNAERLPWMIREEYYQHEENYGDRIGSFYLNTKTLKEVELAIEAMLKKGIKNIYLDEVGKLELDGRGFDKIIRHILAKHVDLAIGVRDKYVNDIVDRYSIDVYRTIDVGEADKCTGMQ